MGAHKCFHEPWRGHSAFFSGALWAVPPLSGLHHRSHPGANQLQDWESRLSGKGLGGRARPLPKGTHAGLSIMVVTSSSA